MRAIGWVVAGLFLAGPPVLAQQQVAPAAPLASAPKHNLAYGTAPEQTLDYYPPTVFTRSAPPLIVFVHGGGWEHGAKDNATGAAKIRHFTGNGYAFATIDYRLVPGATVEQQAQDVATALAWLVAHARDLGFNPNRMVLMGHSAGAHLAALVATDPRYMHAQDLMLDQLRGVVLLDGAAYDVPAQMAEAGRFMRPIYTKAFGTDPARQRALSPVAHSKGPNVLSFLILHVQREDGTRQSEALARALRAEGSKVEVQGFEGRGLRGHVAMNRQLGEADYPATAVVDRWLSATFAPR
ncbi:alpha/beta hydrolase [Sphingomonas sp. ABOLD]|uniref:Acetyl esterase/lipase n=1 Tax=Sphingomonas trueperi TaxID=53317 RepID=A0A7X6BCR6_9SPHN|nr:MULTISPECIES: alpha/beta hydrolase [Sphingomonas]NJB97878.1 acetyl esterase/lipase [Sphingomonas trueperi]RSV40223.1 alpha/beta hydrolase [Sphingomonas sp. ABOLD]RSV41476.1 alpha/beta hydrolase [Sphingomonas sp. ABOLE]